MSGINLEANLLSDRAPVTQSKTFASESAHHGEVLLEVIERLDHELKQLGLAFVVFNQVSLLETLKLDEPLFNCGFQVARFDSLK